MNKYIHNFLLKKYPNLYNNTWWLDDTWGEVYRTPYYAINSCQILITRNNQIIITYDIDSKLIAYWILLYYIVSSKFTIKNEDYNDTSLIDMGLEEINIYNTLETINPIVLNQNTLFLNKTEAVIQENFLNLYYTVADLNNLDFSKLEYVFNIDSVGGQIIIKYKTNIVYHDISPVCTQQYLIKYGKPEDYYLNKELELIYNKIKYLN